VSTLIFGAGFLGERLATSLPGASLARGVDICDEREVATTLEARRPRSVINAAGKTGRPNVDWCEEHPLETARSNVVGALALAGVCANFGMHLVHLASGCVFYGPSPTPGGWREDDFANPSSFYSRTKYAADLVLSRLPGVAVVRLRMPIDSVPGPRNLITKLAGYARVVDVENSVTIVDDLVEVIRVVVDRRASGVFHATNPGPVRHRDLLALYRRFVDPGHEYTMIPEEDLVRLGMARRGRSNCILSSSRLEALGVSMRPTESALPEVFRDYAAALNRRPARGS
jgi:dTDP-4-dehydrorhamnose reductase